MITFIRMQRALLAAASLGLAASPLAAQTAPDAPTTGWVTPTLTFFDVSKGFGDDLTQVLERYDYWRMGDNRRTGVQLDAREFWLVNWSNDRPRWRAERYAASYDNQRGRVQFDTSAVRARGTYRYLRTAADGVEFLYSPNRVVGGTDPQYSGGNVGFFRTFNADTGKTLYYVGRSEVGGSLSVKSDAMADVGSLDVSYDRLGRAGDRFSQYLLGGGDVQGPADARAQLRWRAYDRRVDETLDTGRLQFTLSPRGAFTLDYQISVDRFKNNAPDYELADVTQGIPFSGNYSSWLEQKLERMSREQKQVDARQRTLARELEWVRMGAKARQAKGKARLGAYEKLLAEAQATKDATRELEIAIPPGPRLGDSVIEVKGLRKGYGDRLLIEDLSFSLPKAGIVGIIGANGAGKTTLFRMFTGQEKPDKGAIKLGETVHLGYVDQSRDDLSPNKTVWEEISGADDEIVMGKRTVPSRAYVSWFNFKGATQQRKVGVLSGGERNRVHLAKLLRSGCNLLLLDEPTNDLDVDTLRALEEALLNFAGCAVVISHDRWFLDRIATHILAFEGDSQVVWFSGNYQDYEADRKRRLGAEADRPHRIKYRKLTRS